MPTLTQLEYLVAVDRLRHFGKAAKACHVSQPTLSMQVQKVEDEVGVAIFDRNKKPILPTEKGVTLLEQARAVLREAARFQQLARAAAGELGGEFRLGVIPTLAPYVVPRFVERFTRRFPKVQLHIDETKTADAITLLRSDAMDAALLATPLEEVGLSERPLFYEPFYLYVHPDHPLAARRRISADKLVVDDLWLLEDGHCFRQQVLNLCQVASKDMPSKRSVHFSGGTFETLRNLVRGGRGYTLVPHLFVANLSRAERDSWVKEFVQPAPTREVSLVCRRDHWKADIAEALAQSICATLPPELQDPDGTKKRVVAVSPDGKKG